jgi:hypothetical protein
MGPEAIGVWAVAVGAIACVVAWIARPLLQGGVREPTSSSAAVALLAQREAAIAVLRDLESDRADGRIAADDYERLRAEVVGEGTAALAALDRLAIARDRDGARRLAQIEAEVARRVAARVAPRGPCPACGHLPTPDDRFCGRCGTALADGADP